VVSEVRGGPSLLYVCPVIPSTTGNGLAMRSGMVLEALAEYYRVSLLAVPRYVTMERQVPEIFRKRCADVAIVPPYEDSQYRIQQAGRLYGTHSFDIVHVFRLAALPFARPYFIQSCGRAWLHLDLDDIESKTHRRIAALHRSAGNGGMADVEEARARRSLLLETAAFRMFDRVYVCSDLDRQELLGRCPAEIRVLRNAVRLPAMIRPSRSGEIFRFLFVGTLGYYPNEDAVRYFCSEILPLIRERAATPFRVDFVGAGASKELLDLTAADVHVVGPVADIQPWYESSHAVIVPLRAGGGTRIKILEAFSYQLPVVTTLIGIEGIDAEPNQHVLLAGGPEEFAASCLQLMSDPALAQCLVQNASCLLRESYSSEALKTSVSSL